MSMKNEKYEKLLKIIPSVLEGESSLIANMANLCACIKEEFSHHWIGFYLVDVEKNNLVLGPFQGPLACTRIPFGKGVCGDSWKQEKTLIVSNVHEYPGHIACSSLSNSEIVIPVFNENKLIAVLDIDSVDFNQFDDVDAHYLEKICQLLTLN